MMPGGGGAHNPWWPWALVGLALLGVYGAQLWSMAQVWWDDPNYSHGFLIPVIFGWLLWRQRQALARQWDGPNWWGLVPILLGLFLLLLGQAAREFYLQRVSLLPVAWGLWLLAGGWAVARRAWFAFAYLIFMVPLPYVLYDTVAFPLRLFAADLAGDMIRLAGIPVFVQGNIIMLPRVVLDVVDACSGIRSLVSLLAVAAILAYFWLPNRWSKVLILCTVPPVAVLTNSLRVGLTGILAHHFGKVMLEGLTHDFTGWLVFMAAFGVQVLLTLGLKKLLELRRPA